MKKFLAYAVLLAMPRCFAVALDVNTTNSVNRTAPVVYAFVNDDGKPAAVSYVKTMRNTFWDKSAFIDAGSLPQAELRKQLKNGFTLYASAGEPYGLLADILKDMPLALSTAAVSVGTKHYAGSALRLIFVAQNPYGKGNVTVYSAASNKAIAEINSLYHGPLSYYVFDGKRLLSSGEYDEKAVPLAEAIDDVNEFFKTLKTVHPNLLAKCSPERYLALRNEAFAKIAGAADKNGRVSKEDMAYALAYVAAAFGDGHTSLWDLRVSQRTRDKTRIPPFVLEGRDGKVFIRSADDADFVGAELQEINGIALGTFIKPIIDRCSGESLAFRTTRFISSQRDYWAASGLLNEMSGVTVTIAKPDGTVVRRKVPLMAYEESDRLFASVKPHNNGGTSFSLVADGEIGYFRYPRFMYNDDEIKKVKGIFAEINAKGVKKLVIDIRGNGGGNSDMGDLIAGFLTTKTYSSFSLVEAKISEEAIQRGNFDKEAEPLVGLLVSYNGEKKSGGGYDVFTGSVCLLTDNYTFSSAVDFATLFQRYVQGTIIGYETGGFPTSFGDVLAFKLRNSGLPYGVSYKRFVTGLPRPGDDMHGILPDVPATPAVLAAYKGSDDPVLSFAMDYLNGKADPALLPH